MFCHHYYHRQRSLARRIRTNMSILSQTLVLGAKTLALGTAVAVPAAIVGAQTPDDEPRFGSKWHKCEHRFGLNKVHAAGNYIVKDPKSGAEFMANGSLCLGCGLVDADSVKPYNERVHYSRISDVYSNGRCWIRED